MKELLDEAVRLLKHWAYYDGFCTSCGDTDMDRHEPGCDIGEWLEKVKKHKSSDS